MESIFFSHLILQYSISENNVEWISKDILHNESQWHIIFFCTNKPTIDQCWPSLVMDRWCIGTSIKSFVKILLVITCSVYFAIRCGSNDEHKFEVQDKTVASKTAAAIPCKNEVIISSFTHSFLQSVLRSFASIFETWTGISPSHCCSINDFLSELINQA